MPKDRYKTLLKRICYSESARNKTPGSRPHARARKALEYGIQLREKQKEKILRRLESSSEVFELAEIRRHHRRYLLSILESRLDNVGTDDWPCRAPRRGSCPPRPYHVDGKGPSPLLSGCARRSDRLKKRAATRKAQANLEAAATHVVPKWLIWTRKPRRPSVSLAAREDSTWTSRNFNVDVVFQIIR
jgi:hypothetical protein